MDFKTPIVIDNGSGVVKAGLAGKDEPSCQFPSIVGRHRHKRPMVRSGVQEVPLVGEAVQHKRGILTLSYPIEHGLITNWDDMLIIWGHVYGQLGVNAAEHPVLLTEAPMNPKSNREKMAEIMFEHFAVPALHVGTQGILTLYASGKTTGLVLDCGDGVSHVVPIYQGYPLVHGIRRFNIAGRDVSQFLATQLTNRGIQINTSAERDIVRDIKEKLAYVAQDYAQELSRRQNETKEYVLPDGQKLLIGNESFMCTEALFNPFEQLGYEVNGLHEMVWEAVNKCEMDVRKDLIENIVLSGGTTLLPGLPERLELEVKKLGHELSNVNVNVYAPPHRKYSVWLGGSSMASVPSFKERWVTKSEYLEHGSAVIHRKCGSS